MGDGQGVSMAALSPRHGGGDLHNRDDDALALKVGADAMAG